MGHHCEAAEGYFPGIFQVFSVFAHGDDEKSSRINQNIKIPGRMMPPHHSWEDLFLFLFTPQILNVDQQLIFQVLGDINISLINIYTSCAALVLPEETH